MDSILVRGGRRLEGTLPISGAKNAALPMMIAAVLSEDSRPTLLDNVPDLADARLLASLLSAHGIEVFLGDNSATISAPRLEKVRSPYELVSRMRAGFWMIAPLAARLGRAEVSLPGGCAIGTRPVTFHLDALRAMGADISIRDGYVTLSAPKGLRGAEISPLKPSVGATHCVLMAASLARGTTILNAAAIEPEVLALADMLNAMGAKITAETERRRFVIEGVSRLSSTRLSVPSDRIEAGTYAVAAAVTGGDLELRNAPVEHLEAPLRILSESGADVSTRNGALRVAATDRLRAFRVETAPYPAFPTDLQAQFMAAACVADGTSILREGVFENRFMHVQELCRLGADIRLDGDVASIRGVAALNGAEVMATDLRASSSLILAGLVARGETVARRVYHLDRGFEKLVRKLRGVGADIKRISE